jgi:hypothetical protein
MRVIRLLLQFSRGQLDSLEARLRSVEQLDKRTPRGTSGFGANHRGRINDSLLMGYIRSLNMSDEMDAS